MKTVWLDTDIGSDIDDALACLLARDDCGFVGISTVTEGRPLRDGAWTLPPFICIFPRFGETSWINR